MISKTFFIIVEANDIFNISSLAMIKTFIKFILLKKKNNHANFLYLKKNISLVI